MRILKIPLLLLTFISSSVLALTIDRVVAVVGEEPILQSDVEGLKKELRTSPALANIYQVDSKALDSKKILDRMIEEKIIAQVAKDLDVKVTDVEVENQIGTIAKQNRISKTRLEESLKSEGIAAATYRQNIRTQLERRNVFDRELRRGGGSGGVSESEMRQLYDAKASMEYKITLATFNIPKEKSAAKEALAKIQKSVKRLNSGEATTKEGVLELKGEGLGWLASDGMNPQIFNAIKRLQPGKASAPQVIEGNWSVVILEDQRKGSPEGFEKMKGELSAEAQGQDFQRRFNGWLDRKKRDMNIVVNP